MRTQLFSFLLLGSLLVAIPVKAGDSEMLSGKWSVKRVTAEGQNVTQTLEIKKDKKFVFQILSGDNDVIIHAEGDVKFEDLGPFKSARFLHIRGGDSPSNLSEVDDEYTTIYTIDGDTWMIASNFDKPRQEGATISAYHRVSSASREGGTLVIDAIEMADTPQTAMWYLCFDATVNGVKKQHFLADKGYEKNQLIIPTSLEFPSARSGQKCSFRIQLDDVEEDTCGDEPDQRGTGEFTITERGSQTYKPMAGWEFTIRWHMK